MREAAPVGRSTNFQNHARDRGNSNARTRTRQIRIGQSWGEPGFSGGTTNRKEPWGNTPKPARTLKQKGQGVGRTVSGKEPVRGSKVKQGRLLDKDSGSVLKKTENEKKGGGIKLHQGKTKRCKEMLEKNCYPSCSERRGTGC